MSDGNFNNPGSVSVADQSFGMGVVAQQPGPGPLPFPPTSPSPPTPPSPVNPSNTVVAETSFGQSPTPGISPNFSRGDHSHGTPSDAGLAMTPTQQRKHP